MITRRLWHLLYRSGDVYALIIAREGATSGFRHRKMFSDDSTSVLIVLIFLLTLCGLLISEAVFFFALLAPFILIGISSALCGFVMAQRTAAAITLERKRRRLDVLAVTPMGRLGVYWLMMYLVFHKSSIRSAAHSYNQFVSISAAVVGVWFSIVALLMQDTVGLLPVGLLALGFAALLYVDTLQSTLIGGLMGILFVDKTDPWVIGIGFLLLQSVVYFAVIVTLVIMELLAGLWGIALIFALREIGLSIAWVRMTRYERLIVEAS